MNVTSAVAFATSALLGVSAAICHAEPMKELEVYKEGLGKWTCDVTALESGKSFKSVAEYSAEFDGNTYIERYYEIASPDHPNAWKGIFIMSYDPQSRQWVRNGVDNSGERNTATARGWNDNTWVWEGDGFNVLINQQGTNVRTFAIEVKDGSGTKRVEEGKCKRG